LGVTAVPATQVRGGGRSVDRYDGVDVGDRVAAANPSAPNTVKPVATTLWPDCTHCRNAERERHVVEPVAVGEAVGADDDDVVGGQRLR